jgi:hypothetical protein
MNAISQRNKLEIQLKSFKDFMPLCPPDDLLKLMNEMAKIISRLEKIREYNLKELVSEVPHYYETKQSKLNFKTT